MAQTRKPPSWRSLSVAVALACATATPAFAAGDETQAWGALTASGPMGDQFNYGLEVQTRSSDDLEDLGQLLLRGAVGYRLGDRTTLHIGYAYVETDRAAGGDSEEDRLWQQISRSLLKTEGGLALTSRTRLEQRRLNGSDDTGWRLRQQLRASAPLDGGPVGLVAWTEPFYNIDDTDWGARQGLDQWRTFIGINLPLGSRLSIEPGYLHQHINRQSGDRNNHILSVSFSMRF